jgi:hypothetical protein
MCVQGSGICSTYAANEGAPCDAGYCEGVCTAGFCEPTVCPPPDGGPCVADQVCPPPDDCHEFGACDPASGSCQNPAKPDGQPCAKGVCTGGVCTLADAGADGSSGPGSAGACGCEVRGSGASGVVLAAVAMLVLALRRARRGG